MNAFGRREVDGGHARRMLAAAVSMTAAASLAVLSGTASAAEQPDGTARAWSAKIGQAGLGETEVTSQKSTVKAGFGEEKCVSVPPDAKQGRAGAVEECVQIIQQASATGTRSRTESSATTLTAAQAGAETCSIGQPGHWTYERSGSCPKDMIVDWHPQRRQGCGARHGQAGREPGHDAEGDVIRRKRAGDGHHGLRLAVTVVTDALGGVLRRLVPSSRRGTGERMKPSSVARRTSEEPAHGRRKS